MNAEKHVFVIVLAQEKTVAQALLDCNGGARVLPLPGCFTGEPQSPDWNETNWTVDQLVELVHCKDEGKCNDDEEIRQLVHPGMTPLEVVKVVNARKRKSHETPDNPKKRRASRVLNAKLRIGFGGVSRTQASAALFSSNPESCGSAGACPFTS